MSDLIRRQDAIDAVNKNRDSVFHNSVNYEGALYDISNLPSAQDVRENVHAKFVSEIIKKPDWKGQMQSYYQPNSCSNCHTALTGKENFCPNCGADMREGGEDGEIYKC